MARYRAIGPRRFDRSASARTESGSGGCATRRPARGRHAFPLGVARADFDHDGDVDMVVGASSGQPAPRQREHGPVEGPHQHPLILAASVLVNNDRTLGDSTYEVRRVRFFAATRTRAVGAFFQRRS